VVELECQALCQDLVVGLAVSAGWVV